MVRVTDALSEKTTVNCLNTKFMPKLVTIIHPLHKLL